MVDFLGWEGGVGTGWDLGNWGDAGIVDDDV